MSFAELLFGKPPKPRPATTWKTLTRQAREIEQLEGKLAAKDAEIERLRTMVNDAWYHFDSIEGRLAERNPEHAATIARRGRRRMKAYQDSQPSSEGSQ